MRQVIAGSLRLYAAAFDAHAPQGVVDQRLGVDVGVTQPAEMRIADRGERAPLGLAQGPGLFDFDQVAIDHVFDADTSARETRDSARFIELGLPSTRPDLSGLFSGERLGLLIDLHPVTFYTDLSGVANASVRPFSHSNSGHG